MNIQNKFLQLAGESDLTTILKNVINKVGLELNCIRVGIIQSFNIDDLTVEVLIANKKTIGINKDGTQNTRDYALVTAKVCYCCPYITYPIKQGEECILLFNDRELESWFISGEAQPEAYPRMHDLTDCIAIVGLRSMAKMISIRKDTLNIFYGQSTIRLQNDNITSYSSHFRLIAEDFDFGNGALKSISTLTATNLNALGAASGTFTTSDNKLVTVTNGIVTSIAAAE